MSEAMMKAMESSRGEIAKRGKGRNVILKGRISEPKKALGIEVDDDDDMPF